MNQVELLSTLLARYAEAQEALEQPEADLDRAMAIADSATALVAGLDAQALPPELAPLANDVLTSCRRVEATLAQVRERLRLVAAQELHGGGVARAYGDPRRGADARFLDRRQ
jgi:hypothetical protein